MMKIFYNTIFVLLLSAIVFALQSCDDRDASDLLLNGNTKIESITVNGFKGVIDETAKVVNVSVSTEIDLANLHIDDIVLSEGATCNYPKGTYFNGMVPRSIKVVNGNVFSAYTIIVKHDDVEFLKFTINGKYEGTIDNLSRTIQCFVPMEEDITAMQATFTVNEGTTVTPESGSLLDFSQPVKFIATQRTAVIEYTVSVIQNDMSQAPKAFIGNASAIEGLGEEAMAACRWMLENVPNTRYVSIQDIIDGRVKLDDYRMIWCHFDWTDWPGQLWDSRDQFNTYWLHGGSILASRDGARYINDVWRIARDQQSPNNLFGGDGYETLSEN
ncbi:MAG: DUF4960 domain-containing protein, partial [Muribaculaceae bacterium]|nr:DUF4960 domain-containing protein [Muribaculaceae bacterium]